MPLTTVIILTESQSSTEIDAGNGMAGYRLDLSVSEVENINSKIFILQREVLTEGGMTYEDQFYSVASVGQMESVPEAIADSSPFYRVSSVSLIFENMDDLIKYRAVIFGLINRLRAANDRVLEMSDPVMVGFPPESLARYWGLSSGADITDDILNAGDSDNVWSNEMSKALLSDGSLKYLYVAYRANLPDLDSILVGGFPVAFTVATRAVVNSTGHSANFKVFRSTSALNDRNLLLETVSA